MSSKYLNNIDKLSNSVDYLSETIKITSLNVDCMEFICDYLDLNDLLNVADSSKAFYAPICRIFKKKFLNKNIVFQGTFNHFEIETFGEDNFGKFPEIYIGNPRIALKVLRNFGHMLENLAISFFYFHVDVCLEIEYYLAEYCSESLQRLSIDCNLLKKLVFEHLHKPLKEVTTLKIYTVYSSKLSVYQLLSEKLPKIKYFHMQIMCPQALEDCGNFELQNIEYCTIDGSKPKVFPFLFRKMKHLTFGGNLTLNDEFCEWIKSIKHLKTLRIMRAPYPEQNGFQKMFQLPNILSHLEHMQIELYRDTSPDDIIQFMEHSKSLRKFYIHIEKPEDCIFDLLKENCKKKALIMSKIISKLSVDWKFHIIYPYEHPHHDDTFECYVFEKNTFTPPLCVCDKVILD